MLSEMRAGHEERRRGRALWAGERRALDDATDAGSVGGTPSERVAMVHQVTMDAWAMSGKPWPSYDRSRIPGRLVRGGR